MLVGALVEMRRRRCELLAEVASSWLNDDREMSFEDRLLVSMALE